MNQGNFPNYPRSIKSAMFQTLLRRIPPKSFSPHLEDIVDTLMDALARGELDLNLDNDCNQNELKNSGWPKAHKEALLASGWLEGEDSPIVLENNQLSWRRWHNEMSTLVENLIFRSKSKNTEAKKSTSKQIPNPDKTLNPDQQIAVKAIEEEQVVLLSGGPGTGKTSTILQMIERAIFITPNLNVGLAAPTGKAARRLQESLSKGIKSLHPRHQESLGTIPCKTIHRWLEARPQGFAKNKQNPLNIDLLVVDEMSMVDLEVMKSLIDALPQRTQLVLVGDPNQLPPIDSGAIWHQLQKENVLLHFGEGAIHLKRSYRNRGELASLSKRLCEEGISAFWEHLFHLPKEANIKSHQFNVNSIPPVLINRLKGHVDRLESLTKLLVQKLPNDFHLSCMQDIDLGRQGEELLYCLEELMILCPTHFGAWGVDEVHKTFLGRNFEEDISSWPQGTPVMCCENQPELQLANGDIGIVIGEENQRRVIFRVFSETRKLTTQFIHPARIKRIKPALAMTVHKAQGSEADEVFVLWPDNYTESLLSDHQKGSSKSYEKRLLYTAITRARKKVDLVVQPGE